MQELIKKAVLRLFPELSSGVHLDRYARVKAVNDAPVAGSASERFRPRYSVDLVVLTADLEPDPVYPVYTAVPLPLSLGCGHESGLYAFPQPGSLAVIAFAYGQPDHPIIRQLYPLGTTMPAVGARDMLIQQGPEFFQRADANGNWQRQARGEISDSSGSRLVEARFSKSLLVSESREVKRDSLTEVGGVCRLKAGLLDAMAAMKVDIGTLGEANITAGTNGTFSTGVNFELTVGGNLTEKVSGSGDKKGGGNRTSTVTKKDTLKAASQSVTITDSREIKAKTLKETVTATYSMDATGPVTVQSGGAVGISGATVTLSSGAGVIALGGGGGGGDKDVLGQVLECLKQLTAACTALNNAVNGKPATTAIGKAGEHLTKIENALK